MYIHTIHISPLPFFPTHTQKKQHPHQPNPKKSKPNTQHATRHTPSHTERRGFTPAPAVAALLPQHPVSRAVRAYLDAHVRGRCVRVVSWGWLINLWVEGWIGGWEGGGGVSRVVD